MSVLPKSQWMVTANGGTPRAAAEFSYSTQWAIGGSTNPWIEIDLGQIATLGGLEVYWSRHAAETYAFVFSLDGVV
jgi:hypothetical protein